MSETRLEKATTSSSITNMAKPDIVDFLHQSEEQLGELKKQVHDLDLFFISILNDVDVTVRKDVKREFLRPINKSILTNRAGMVIAIVMDDEARTVSGPPSTLSS